MLPYSMLTNVKNLHSSIDFKEVQTTPYSVFEIYMVFKLNDCANKHLTWSTYTRTKHIGRFYLDLLWLA
jgi:hypothetical protein